mmetsp:Transcript_30942/g.71318  ORF Transcript_30942/g.71318 Transcript_30942/m.71318 type:complete len:201 (+) Transcript_30942:166-768(+)
MSVSLASSLDTIFLFEKKSPDGPAQHFRPSQVSRRNLRLPRVRSAAGRSHPLTETEQGCLAFVRRSRCHRATRLSFLGRKVRKQVALCGTALQTCTFTITNIATIASLLLWTPHRAGRATQPRVQIPPPLYLATSRDILPLFLRKESDFLSRAFQSSTSNLFLMASLTTIPRCFTPPEALQWRARLSVSCMYRDMESHPN